MPSQALTTLNFFCSDGVIMSEGTSALMKFGFQLDEDDDMFARAFRRLPSRFVPLAHRLLILFTPILYMMTVLPLTAGLIMLAYWSTTEVCALPPSPTHDTTLSHLVDHRGVCSPSISHS